ncbi:hotdog fold thioesterase [Streptacidiphilus sp. PAMC 29251]
MSTTTLGAIPVLPGFADEQLTERLGITLTTCTAELVVGTMPVSGNRQPIGLLHGGANAAFAETLGSVAAWMQAGTDRVIVGRELSCTHLAPARSGLLTGVARPLEIGPGSGSYEIRISDETGREVCSARLTCALPAPRRVGRK